MKLQTKISILFLTGIFLSTFFSLFLIKFFIFFFDKSYSRNDIEKVASEVTKQISELKNYDLHDIKNILNEIKINNGNFNFTLIDEKREPVASTEPIPNREELIKRLEEQEKNANTKEGELHNDFKFIGYFSTRDFVLRKPILFNNKIKGVLFVNINKEYLLPFYIRLNSEKNFFLYSIFFGSILLIIIISFLLVFLFTIPLIRRLKNLSAKINNFELEKPNFKINDNHRDEIGAISNTFDKMALKINENYNEMKKFYSDRQELLKNISHDFRTPLTSILGYSISLDEGMFENEEERKRYIQIIRKKAAYMSVLFNEMMELTRLDNNSYVLKKTEFNIAEMIREIIIEYLAQLENEKFFIETEIPESIIINADKERLSRVIRNIIDNVIKHAN